MGVKKNPVTHCFFRPFCKGPLRGTRSVSSTSKAIDERGLIWHVFAPSSEVRLKSAKTSGVLRRVSWVVVFGRIFFARMTNEKNNEILNHKGNGIL